MRCHSIILGAVLALAGCSSDSEAPVETAGDPGVPQAGAVGTTVPLSLQADLTRQPVARATCTRGNSFARIRVDPVGRVSGELTDSKRPIAGTLVSRDAKTVVFTVEEGTVGGNTVGEPMQITTDGQRVMLTGSTFICRGVEIWPEN